MRYRTALHIVTFIFAAAACSFAAAYLAGLLYFVANKTTPQPLHLTTWFDYWSAYGHDARQRPRLQFAALAAVLMAFMPPLLVFIASKRHQRALHGEARWATDAEIRAAGLL